MATKLRIHADRIVLGPRAGSSELEIAERSVIEIDANGTISLIGDPPLDAVTSRTLHAPLVTAGLVDAHTHAAWAGSRHDEYALRMAGADYVAIAAAGGGIQSTQRAIADTSEDELTRLLVARLRRMARQGVTTVEVKSGYGLVPELELRQLRAIARAASKPDLPRVVPTFLALHAVPDARKADRERWLGEMIELVSEVAAGKLAEFVDAYVDAHAFGVDDARRLGTRARELGLGVRLHVGQFSDIGGAELAAELGAASVDHVEHVSAAGAAALARAGTTAVLLPVASFTLGQAPPPVAMLRDAGVRLAIASDANPGTAPTESLPLAMALAVRTYGMRPAEALLGATTHAAHALARPGGGVVRVGGVADLVLWDLPHENALVQPWGVARARAVLRGGEILVET
jgi:imidazolonepropionase